MTLDEVVASNASAFRGLLIERGLLADPNAACEGREVESSSVADGDDVDSDGDEEEAVDEDEDVDDVEDEDVEDSDVDDADDDDVEEDALEVEDDDVAEDVAEDEADDEADDEDESGSEEDVEEVNAEEGDVPLVLQEVAGTRYEDVREELEEEVNRLRRRLKSMGSVNTDSLNDLDELESKFEHFNSQLMDLTEAKNTLEDIIRKINVESRRIFLESFEKITV